MPDFVGHLSRGPKFLDDGIKIPLRLRYVDVMRDFGIHGSVMGSNACLCMRPCRKLRALPPAGKSVEKSGKTLI